MGILIPIVNALFFVFYALMFANIIFSWIRPDPYHPTWGPIIRFVYSVTEPLLQPVRRFLPSMGGLDFSPLIVFLVARLLQGLVIGVLA